MHQNFTKQLPLTIVLDRVRSAYNVGSVLRTAACAHAASVITCEFTPPADNAKVHKTALGSETMLKNEHFPDLKSAVENLRANGYQVFAIEMGENSQSLWETKFDFSSPTALIFGHEVNGLEVDYLESAGIQLIEIPMPGPKKSLNIANASAIAIYEFARQFYNS